MQCDTLHKATHIYIANDARATMGSSKQEYWRCLKCLKSTCNIRLVFTDMMQLACKAGLTS
jgi:hypothetical protein